MVPSLPPGSSLQLLSISSQKPEDPTGSSRHRTPSIGSAEGRQQCFSIARSSPSIPWKQQIVNRHCKIPDFPRRSEETQPDMQLSSHRRAHPTTQIQLRKAADDFAQNCSCLKGGNTNLPARSTGKTCTRVF